MEFEFQICGYCNIDNELKILMDWLEEEYRSSLSHPFYHVLNFKKLDKLLNSEQNPADDNPKK